MSAHALKARLPRTWSAFFGRYGNFTAIQLQGIPLLLDGQNVLLYAGTASGKTEAAIAPLIERHLPPNRVTPRLSLLYLLPTRALINQMSARLAVPFGALRIRAALKTRDFNTFDTHYPADVLLTTPESLDSLLASNAKTLIHVRAVIIDELHDFDSTVRGDQLRVLLNRLRVLRTYAAAHSDADDDQIQYAALSATVAQPEISAARYFPAAQIVSTDGQRPLHTELIALEEANPSALFDYLNTFRTRGWKKALIFCNTRAEVEFYAAQTRTTRSPFGDAVFVHYSNLERELRREIEQQFAQAEAAICFASSTLELGIDIGSVDAVLLIGAPGSVESYIQRVGRANRRAPTARAACFCRTSLERVLFDALQTMSAGDHLPLPFRPSAAVQQIFSLIKASPTGALRLNPTAALFAGLLSAHDLQFILSELQAADYLKPGRPGEWRAGDRLNRLVDLQATEHAPFSLYSNIQTDTTTIKVRDHLTHRVIANVDRFMLDQDGVLIGGRALNIEWNDGDALWVSTRDTGTSSRLRYRAARPVLSYDLARRIPAVIGLNESAAPYVPIEDGWRWFHWLGDIYGRALVDLLRYTVSAEISDHPGLCILLADEPHSIPLWTIDHVRRYLLAQYRHYERLLALGAYHHLLPLELRRRAVVEQFNVPRFLQAVNALHIQPAPETLVESLDAFTSTTTN